MQTQHREREKPTTRHCTPSFNEIKEKFTRQGEEFKKTAAAAPRFLVSCLERRARQVRLLKFAFSTTLFFFFFVSRRGRRQRREKTCMRPTALPGHSERGRAQGVELCRRCADTHYHVNYSNIARHWKANPAAGPTAYTPHQHIHLYARDSYVSACEREKARERDGK